jgi:hypothetical protein
MRIFCKRSIVLAAMVANVSFAFAQQNLLPVQVGAFHKRFNEIAARAALSDIQAVPTGCMRKQSGRRDYRLGEHSVVSVIGSNPEGNAYVIQMISTARTRAQSQMVMSSILILTEIAAPEASATDRAHVVQELFRNMDRAVRTRRRRGFAKIFFLVVGRSLDITMKATFGIEVRRPGGCAPRPW